jgi:hypothetical protein
MTKASAKKSGTSTTNVPLVHCNTTVSKLKSELGRENVEAVSADLVALPQAVVTSRYRDYSIN